MSSMIATGSDAIVIVEITRHPSKVKYLAIDRITPYLT